MIREKCIICEEQTNEGIKLYTTFICLSCEHTLIHTEPREEKYNYYVKKLKHLNDSPLYAKTNNV